MIIDTQNNTNVFSRMPSFANFRIHDMGREAPEIVDVFVCDAADSHR